MQVENFQKLMDTVAQIDEQGRKAVKATVRDVKARAPSWSAQEVTSVYNIKKGEITPSGKSGSSSKSAAGIATYKELGISSSAVNVGASSSAKASKKPTNAQLK